MSSENENFDFNSQNKEEIRSTLEKYNIPLKADEALKVQNNMLGRVPSLSELILFSIQGSEHSSYKSSRSHLKLFTTSGPDVVLGAEEDAGVAISLGREVHLIAIHIAGLSLERKRLALIGLGILKLR